MDGRVKVWDLKTKQERTSYRALNSWGSVEFDKRATRLAAAAGEGFVRVFDFVSGLQLLNLKTPTGYLGRLRFLDSGNVLVCSGYGGLQIWRAPSWEEIVAAETSAAR